MTAEEYFNQEAVMIHHTAYGYMPIDLAIELAESYAQEKCSEQREADNSNIDKLLDAQIGEVAVFVDRCARDKGMANREFDKWIKDTPKIQYHKNTPLVTTKTDDRPKCDECGKPLLDSELNVGTCEECLCPE